MSSFNNNKYDVFELIRTIPRKNYQRLRGIITKTLIYPWECEKYDTILCSVIDYSPVVIRNGYYYCEICRRKLKTFKSIFYHLLNAHQFLIDDYVVKYLIYKLKYQGIIK